MSSKVRVEKYLRESVLNHVVELEKRVWGKEGYREVNAPMLYFELAYITNGLVLTAFDEGLFTPEEKAVMAGEDPWYEGDKPIGFLCCFADFDARGPFWYGARMGVDHRYRDQDIGGSILSTLYACAVERQIPRIRWTFDPLISKNGYLYINKMGGLVKEIGFNYYSAVFTNDQFNRGISTDRFVLEWEINSERVQSKMAAWGKPSADSVEVTPENTVNEIEVDEHGLERHGTKFIQNARFSPLFVEIPYAQDKILKVDRVKAQLLREKCRALFMHYLARGYVVTDLVLKKDPDGRRHTYYRLDQEAEWRLLKL